MVGYEMDGDIRHEVTVLFSFDDSSCHPRIFFSTNDNVIFGNRISVIGYN